MNLATLVIVGASSLFGGPCDSGDNDISAFGLNTRQPIIALPRRDTAGKPFLVTMPNRRQVVAIHGDYGPAGWTGIKIDVGWLTARATGYSICAGSYPTGATVRIKLLTGERAVCEAVDRTRTKADDRRWRGCRWQESARAVPVPRR